MRALAVLVMILLALPLAGATWLQQGHDGGHSFTTRESGPDRDEVAWTRPFPDLVRGSLLVTPEGIVGTSASPNASERVVIDPVTGDVLRRSPLDLGAVIFATRDGTDYAVSGKAEVEALDARSGAVLWRYLPPGGNALCLRIAVDGPDVVAGCYDYVFDDPTNILPITSPASGLPVQASVVALLDAATGKARWETRLQGNEGASGALCDGTPMKAAVAPLRFPSVSTAGGVIVASAIVAANSTENVPTPRAPPTPLGRPYVAIQGQQGVAVGLDRAKGTPLWHVATNVTPTTGGNLSQPNAPGVPPAPGHSAPPFDPPVGDGSILYSKLDDQMVAFNGGTGAPIWCARVQEQDQRPDYGGVGIAFSPGRLDVVALQTLTRFDAAKHQRVWSFASPANLSLGGLLSTPRAEYVAEYSDANVGQAPAPALMVALDPADGHVLFEHEFPTDGQGVGVVSDGFLVVHIRQNVSLLGHTARSIEVAPRVASTYPAPRATVTVDVSGAQGADGPATEFRADWGDGTITEWRSSPTFTHAYSSPGDVDARFSARNPAGQTSTTLTTFHVGSKPPTALETAFSERNQNTTFFVLGLAVTVMGAGVGFARYRRKRSRLQRELRALDELRAPRSPPEWETALAARRIHAHRMLLEGSLDEAQYAVLSRKLEELARDVRLLELDVELHFLPHGLVLQLQEMLSDGHITAYEKRHFLEALDRDALLPAEYKQKLRERVEDWARRDSSTE